MKQRVQQLTKLIVFDTLGGLLMIAALLTGWLPGPGGFPLFFAGLGLISLNHEWARRLLVWMRARSSLLLTALFPNRRWIQRTYDVFMVLLLIMAIAVVRVFQSPFRYSAAVFLAGMAVLILIGNRDRWHKLKKRFPGKSTK